ncbi:MAG: histidine kinase [Calditrichaeota bacterium]|nr:histidine kinase [Candidatus Cloacimonadota bacterium]MCA9784982.1 histidine kinase [Candidatus Cloacimonadota bacterium]MCB1046774.1 histidine kinase [Calditrichota bacterium]MCB9474530.1 histidine kinase [Candidatus Delongbacteria bacterium]
MQRRVNEILLVASEYDAFILAQDGQLQDLILSEFVNMNLYHAPKITRVARASRALAMLSAGRETREPEEEDSASSGTYDLILMTTNVGDMHVLEFARSLRNSGVQVPVILLAYENRELEELLERSEMEYVDQVFVWQGDFRILLAIVKYVEDFWNLEHDTKVMGVQVIILIEDNIRFYSSFLPNIYTEVVKQSQRLIFDGLNLAHRMLRQKARPKILLCTDYDQAWTFFERYADFVLGIITDLEYPKGGVNIPDAGAQFARQVRGRFPDMPVMIQSSQPRVMEYADLLNTAVARKDSPTLLKELRTFMQENFGFGDFVFRLEDGTEIARARDLQTLERILTEIPDATLEYHASRDHFSKWLKARTEFGLARKLQARKVDSYPSMDDLRNDLIACIRNFRLDRTRGVIAEFKSDTFDPTNSFAQLGQGSMGGKARGLSFVRHLINRHELWNSVPGVCITIPPAVMLNTGVFDDFMELNGLEEFAVSEPDDQKILARFLDSEFPPAYIDSLKAIVQLMDYPLAVRSSSLLEDSQYQPFAGIYRTCMLPNSSHDPEIRLEYLLRAIKMTYASTYSREAKAYIDSTPYRLEEEKMGVIIQKLVGQRHGDRFYPSMAGVARSWNFYPSGPMKAEDGVANVVLGLGRMVVDGGSSLRFCPRYPQHHSQFGTMRDYLDYSQKVYYGLDLGHTGEGVVDDNSLPSWKVAEAEKEGTLGPVASVFSPENNAVYDGLSRPGVRLVTFAPILKHSLFPLPEVLVKVLKLGTRGMSRPVEIEFTAQLGVEGDELPEFNVVQMRPLVLTREVEEIHLEQIPEATRLCYSTQVLGAGNLELNDIICVNYANYERRRSKDAALEVGKLNARLKQLKRRYLLIGVGRWGSSDPWLGIPVSWDQINGASVIIESGFKDFIVTPSQGSHFFQNLSSLGIGYFTVNPDEHDGSLDWEFLATHPAEEEGELFRHLHFQHPFTIRMDGRRGCGVVIKPEA